MVGACSENTPKILSHQTPISAYTRERTKAKFFADRRLLLGVLSLLRCRDMDQSYSSVGILRGCDSFLSNAAVWLLEA